jgi:predicted Zn-dependent protease
MKKLYANPLLYIAILLIIGSCTTVPIIGRKQINLLPESQLVSLSLTNYKTFLDTSEVISSGSDYAMVKQSGEKISRAVEKFLRDNELGDRINQFKWEFNLVKDNTPNAWAMPGGKVVFFSGIMPLCLNENGIAVVMGHEIAHAVARHGNERMSQGLLTQLGGMALDVALDQQPEKTKSIFNLAYGIGAQVGLILPYSRKHEYEADKLGLIFMTMAGYNPNEAINFWQRMAAQNKNNLPEFLSTHPIDDKRIAELKKFLPEAEKYRP